MNIHLRNFSIIIGVQEFRSSDITLFFKEFRHYRCFVNNVSDVDD